MNKTEETKIKAFERAGIKKLPKEINGAFKGLAVIEMAKTGGAITWGLGRWNSYFQRVTVAEDFDKRMIEKILKVYPYQTEENVTRRDLSLKKANLIEIGYNPKEIKSWTNKRCDDEFAEIEISKGILYNLTKEVVEDDTLDNINEKIFQIHKEKTAEKERSKIRTKAEREAEEKAKKELEEKQAKELERLKKINNV